MGLPGTRSASPLPARVVSALPTAPADLARALAISPVLQGPGWSARYSATWRRSWPLPSRMPRGHPRGGGRDREGDGWGTRVYIHGEGHHREINKRNHLPGAPITI